MFLKRTFIFILDAIMISISCLMIKLGGKDAKKDNWKEKKITFIWTIYLIRIMEIRCDEKMLIIHSKAIYFKWITNHYFSAKPEFYARNLTEIRLIQSMEMNAFNIK